MAEFSNLETITKRNGQTVAFDVSLIQKAVKRAFEATGESNIKIDIIIYDILRKLSDAADDGKEINVELCQDKVEEALMHHECYDTARAYVVYRFVHNKKRKRSFKISQEMKELAKESLSYFESPYEFIIYLRTYAKWIEEKGRRELWPETVQRYMNFMISQLGPLGSSGSLSYEEYELIKNAILRMDIMPSMRLLQFAGEAAARNNLRAYNCSYVAFKDLISVRDAMYLLMNGTGVGYSVESKYINQMPFVKHQTGEVLDTYSIPDTAEGWCDAFYFGMQTWFDGKDINFDYDLIRPSGAKLKTSGGTASGPGPLKELLVFTRKVVLESQGKQLSCLTWHDIACKVGKIVVVGGVRRAAMISLSDLGDKAMRECKSGKWWEENLDRRMANNSAVYETKPDMKDFMTEWVNLAMSGSGERGIFNRSNLTATLPKRRVELLGGDVSDLGTNPCVTSDTMIPTTEGYKSVHDLVGKKFTTFLNGGRFDSTDKGFYSTGVKEVYEIVLESGNRIKATKNHEFYGSAKMPFKDCNWVAVEDLSTQDYLCVADNSSNINGVSKIKSINLIGEEEVFDCSILISHCYIANGFVSHNCGEIILQHCGLCNLTTYICRPNDTVETLKQKARLAAILGTYQSKLTKFKYVQSLFNDNCISERLLGVSAAGQQDCPAFRNPEVMQALKKLVNDTNIEYAHRFGIRASSCTTAVKPDGTLGAMTNASCGVHPDYDEFYIRRVRMSIHDPVCKMLMDLGVPCNPENGSNWNNVDTVVFDFPKKAKPGSVIRKDLTAVQMLEYTKMVKINYTEHNPSNTVSVRPHEWGEAGAWVYDNWDFVGGNSFLNDDGGTYTLAPFESISEEKYHSLVSKFPSIDFSKLPYYEHEDKTDLKGVMACSGGLCTLVAKVR